MYLFLSFVHECNYFYSCWCVLHTEKGTLNSNVPNSLCKIDLYRVQRSIGHEYKYYPVIRFDVLRCYPSNTASIDIHTVSCVLSACYSSLYIHRFLHRIQLRFTNLSAFLSFKLSSVTVLLWEWIYTALRYSLSFLAVSVWHFLENAPDAIPFT